MKSNPSIKAVIFDISGTVMDFGSRGPIAAFVELFHRHGVQVSADEARRPMGTHKIDHIWSMLTDPEIAERWQRATGSAPTRELLDELYPEFTRLQIEVLTQHCDLIPDVLAVVDELRSRGIKFANTTGFDSWMMDDLKRLAHEAGYLPELWVTPELVGKGRPAPWMIFHALKEMNIYPTSSVVKVGDTIADIEEARNAGVWMVSVVECGNEVGLSRDELTSMSESERQDRITIARERLAAHDPHYLISTTADLIPIIDDINRRLAAGERP